MKLLTLNTHSLVEENYERKLHDFTKAIATNKPDVIALQEVNQTCTEEIVPPAQLSGYVSCGSSPAVRRDNHVYNAVRLLAEKGIDYYWTWLGMKLGYDKYDEGIALMSRSRILEARSFTVSGIDDYHNWKTRKIIGIRTEKAPDTWFFSVHLGWWNDEEELFQDQWHRLETAVSGEGTVWLMGDFNSPAEVREEGYDMISRSDWHDSFILAEKRDSGITVGGAIDGWRDKISGDCSGMRIDQLWCSDKIPVKSSRVIFNGDNAPVVSDHYGVIIETRDTIK